jgi:hypothetical protein
MNISCSPGGYTHNPLKGQHPSYYSFRAKHRTKFQKKSGGIIIVFKNYLEPFLHFPDTESDFVQWLKLFLFPEKQVYHNFQSKK